MSTRKTNLNSTERQTVDKAAVVAGRDLELAYADALLDQVDTAQQQIRNIQNDIALLQTMENALGLISENMARVRRLSLDMLGDNVTHAETRIASDEIRNLTMIYMLIVEDTEFDGHFLFKDDVLKMRSCETGELTLTTVKIPEISGVETGDFQAILDSVDGIARTINRQYQRINTVMQTLLSSYQLLRTEIELLLKAQKRLINHQGH
jgi:flagellin-like hook-associated protein FlgL